MKQNLRSPLLGADTQRTAEISAVDPLSRKSLAKQAAWESFSYDPWYRFEECQTSPLRGHFEASTSRSAVYEAFLQAKRDWDFQKVTILRWTLNFIIGTSVALVGKPSLGLLQHL